MHSVSKQDKLEYEPPMVEAEAISAGNCFLQISVFSGFILEQTRGLYDYYEDEDVNFDRYLI